jgi:HlyD family secretion protein
MVNLTGCAAGGANGPIYDYSEVKTGDLASVLVLNGVVRPNRLMNLDWQTSGQVEKVASDTLGKISEGQSLASLKFSSVPQTVIMAKVDLLQAQKALDDLQVSKTTLAQAKLELATAQEELKKAKQQFESTASGKRAVNQAFLDGARLDYVQAQQEARDAEEMYSAVAGLPEENTVRILLHRDLNYKRQARDKALYNLNYMLGKPSQQEIDKANAQLAVAQSRVEDAQRTFDRVKNGVPASELEAAKARVEAAKATLDQVEVKAPFDGVVTYRRVREGDIVKMGDNAFQIEDRSHLYVDVSVSEIDINMIQVGQPVVVSFDAILDKKYNGKVSQIGLSGTRNQNSVTFPVVIELVDVEQAIKSGMTAAVRIQTQEVKNVLVVPNQAVRVFEGERVVFVPRGAKTPEMVKIKLGISSDAMSEVRDGDLKVGEKVVMNPDSLLQMQMMTTGEK